MRKLILTLTAALLPLGLAGAKPAPAPNQPNTPDVEPGGVHTYILLDRTGSMSGIWDEALNSVNAYAKAVGNEADGDTLETPVTLAAFDFQAELQFDMLRTGVTPGDWKPVTSAEVSPRGMTPLFDAIGRMVSVAESDSPDKAVIVIMTDGAENSSREITREGAKAALDRVEKKGWEVVFLGAEFSTFDDADAVGISADKQMAVGAAQLSVTAERLAQKSRNYASGTDDEIEFDEADRAAAGEDEVKQRTGGNR